MSDQTIDRIVRHIRNDRFRPYNLVDGKEIISYPWPERGCLWVNVRTVPGDPTTMRTFEIVEGELVEQPV